MHAAINNTKDIVPSAVLADANPFALSASLVAWFTAALLWICAAYFLFRMRSAGLQRGWLAMTGVRDDAAPGSV